MSASDDIQTKIQREITDLTISITGMVESFKQFQIPLVESKKKVPQATNQLDKITEQTEEVTTRMLEIVEKITQREDDVIKGIAEIRQHMETGQITEIDKIISGMEEKANHNLNDAFAIMESLQFQDITAQQMDHAASLLEEIEKRLHGVLKTIGVPEADVLEQRATQTRKVRAYDPHAEFVDKKTDQEEIDSLFSQK